MKLKNAEGDGVFFLFRSHVKLAFQTITELIAINFLPVSRECITQVYLDMTRKTVFYLLCLLFLTSITIGRAAPIQKPYVILISFDGFRWDFPHRGLTPNLKMMAEQGVSALSLRPVFPTKTFPNHLSIITGMYPENHGIILNEFYDRFKCEKYKVGDEKSVQQPRWYQGEAFWETAERQGIITASYFWPGSELTLEYRRPTYVEHYDQDRPYETRIAGIIKWLQLPEEQRPHFITIYFEATDSKGHQYGPDSPENNRAIQQLDSTLGLLLAELRKLDCWNAMNVIVISDHGMTNVTSNRIIDIETILDDMDYRSQGYGPVMMVDCADTNRQAIYERLRRNENHFKAYLKEHAPDYFHFKHHPFISPIILIAEMGWTLVNHKRNIALRLYGTDGDHGYDPYQLDMHGIFHAMGPAFKQGYRTGTLWNIDIYPLLCQIFDIMPRQNIDGKLERIGFILE